MTIQLDVPHDIDLDSLQRDDYDAEKLKALFMELEFDTLGKRLFGKSFSSAQTRAQVIREKREKEIQATLFDEPVERKDDRRCQARLQNGRDRQRPRSTDQKTAGPGVDLFRHRNNRARSAAGVAAGHRVFLPTAHRLTTSSVPEDRDQAMAVLEEFRPVFENEAIAKIGHNLKYDVTLLKWHGIDVSRHTVRHDAGAFDERARDASRARLLVQAVSWTTNRSPPAI